MLKKIIGGYTSIPWVSVRTKTKRFYQQQSIYIGIVAHAKVLNNESEWMHEWMNEA